MYRALIAAGLVTVAQAKSVLLVLTSHDKLGEHDGDQTGWYLPEAAHPYDVFKKAGVEMTWASPKGGKAPVDEGSVTTYDKDEVSVDFMTKPEEKKLWEETKKLADINPANFDAVFVVGGYGVMWDLVDNEDLHRIAARIYDSGGVVSGVCHGPASLVGVKLADGSSLVKDKKVACFTNAEEDVMKRRDVVPETCQDSYKKAGADYTKGAPWSDHVAEDGRLVTGQNPMSARSTAESVVEKLDKIKTMLMVLTSHDTLGETDGGQTGWYLPEAAHPYYVFKKAGYRMIFASPKGGKAPVDKQSVEEYKKDEKSVNFLTKADAKKSWEETEKLADVDPSAFDGIFVVGGYGVMWDLVKDDDVKRIAASIYDHGGIVSGVCHGPASLVGVKLADGTSLVKGKKVACFSNNEEDVLKRRDVVPQTCQDAYEASGADYTSGDPWSDHVAEAGRLITGQNPMSAKSTAKAVVEAWDAEAKKEKHDKKADDKAAKPEEKFEALAKKIAPEGEVAVPTMGLMALGGVALMAVALVATRSARRYDAGTPADQELLVGGWSEFGQLDRLG